MDSQRPGFKSCVLLIGKVVSNCLVFLPQSAIETFHEHVNFMMLLYNATSVMQLGLNHIHVSTTCEKLHISATFYDDDDDDVYDHL